MTASAWTASSRDRQWRGIGELVGGLVGAVGLGDVDRLDGFEAGPAGRLRGWTAGGVVGGLGGDVLAHGGTPTPTIRLHARLYRLAICEFRANCEPSYPR